MDGQEEVVLDQALSDLINRIAAKLVRQHCPKSVDPRDVAQQVMLDLTRRPLKYDPSKGAKKETLIYTVVLRKVLKCAPGEIENASRFTQFPEKHPPDSLKAKAKRLKLKDILDDLDDEKSRELCRLYVECNGNVSEVARQLGMTEGTVRYRLVALGPRMIKAGYGRTDLSSNERADS